LSNLSENCFPQSTHLSNPIIFHFTYFPPHGFSISCFKLKKAGESCHSSRFLRLWQSTSFVERATQKPTL
jgi:hypothetical protein